MVTEFGNRTITELTEFIGQVYTANLEGMMVAVRVKDFRTVYGRTDACITPENGYGSKWVSIDRLVNG